MPILTDAAVAAIRDWELISKEMKETMARLKPLEMEKRKLVVDLVFGANADYGTNTFELANGYVLKYVRSLDYKLDDSDPDPNNDGATNLDRALDAMRSTGNDGSFVADRLVRFKPELSVTEYKNLSDTHKKIIDKVLTTKDAAPKIEIVGP